MNACVLRIIIRVCGCKRIYLATFRKLNNKSCAQIIETHLQSV